MKSQVRRLVFETNSSSMHSVTVVSGKLAKNTMTIGENNKIDVPVEFFAWGVEDFDDQLNKLSYLVMMALQKERHNCKSNIDFFETDSFKQINDEIAKYCECDGITVDTLEICTKFWKDRDGVDHSYEDCNGGIDHQSHSDYRSLQDFLDDIGTDIINFVFNPEVILHISNDNM